MNIKRRKKSLSKNINIKKIRKQKNKLIQLQILKTYYNRKSSNFENNLKQIQIHLNKISNIIYKYHLTNKKILFLGLPKDFKKTIKNTKHLLIPEFAWFNGLLNNRLNEKSNISLNTFKLLTSLRKKIDLIVIANFKSKSTAIKESYIARIPVITMNHKLSFSNYKTTYTAISNYSLINEKMEPNNLFFSIIKATLNKAKKIKKISKIENLKTSKKTKFYKKFKKVKKHIN